MFHLDPVQRPDLNEIEIVCKKILPLLEGDDLEVLSLKMDEISSELQFVNNIPKLERVPVIDDFEDDEQTVLMSREDQVKSPEPSPLSKRNYVRIMLALYALLMVWVTYKFINSLDKEHSHSEQQKLQAQLKELESQLYNIELPSPPYKKEMVRFLKWLIERETSFLAKEIEIALEKKYI